MRALHVVDGKGNMESICQASSFTMSPREKNYWKPNIVSLATKVGGTCGGPKHVVKLRPFDRLRKENATHESKVIGFRE